MISSVNNHFSKFVDDLIFINIEENKLKKDFGIANEEVLLPIVKSDLLDMAKSEYQSFTSKQIIEGILIIMGADFSFKWNKDYKFLLENKFEDIAQIVKSEIAKDIKNKKLFQGALKIRAYLTYINENDKEAMLYYASLCKEIYVNSVDKKNMKNFFEEAEYYFEEVIKTDPNNVLASFELAYFNLAKDDLEKAKQLMEVVIAYTNDKNLMEEATLFLDNLSINSSLEQGESLIEDGAYVEALKIFHKLKTDSPTLKYKLLYNKGFCYKMLGDADMALENFEEAVQINNMDPLLLAELGLIYGYLGEFEQSLEFYYSALNLEPKNIAILCNLGMIYINMGDLAKAREYIDKALDIDDKDEIAISCLKELRKYE